MSIADPALAHEQLVALFERLSALDAAARDAALAACDADTRDRLQRLLAADAQDDDLLAELVAGQAKAMFGSTACGTRLGAYRVLRELGAGGMGSVLLAERADGQFSQKVAIKLIRGFPTSEGRRRLRQERQILAQLDHPNIAHLVDGGETDDGQPFVVMEFVDGLGLLEHIASHRPSLTARLALFDGIAAAVQHAHERLVIHRDIKPANVLVRADGKPKLLDFGIAKLVDLSAASDPRQTSTRVWTPGYASPEQRAGTLVTTASDVYGLAVLLRELLTGERAVGEPGTPPPGFVGLPLDRDLRGILAKASAEAPTQRYATVEAFRADLHRWRDGRPVRAAPDSAWYRSRKFLARHRLGSLLLVMALVATATFVWRLQHERARALAAEQQISQALQAAQESADTARSALDFLTRALAASMPEHTLSSQVSVRDLLDHARGELDAETLDPRVGQSMQRLLGHLYMSLGEPRIAADLFQAGLENAQAQQRDDALDLADDLDGHASALAALERGAESLQLAQRSAALRRRFAPGDAEQDLRALNQLGLGHYRVQDYAHAEDAWARVIAIAATLQSPPVDIVTNAYQTLASMLAMQGEHVRALELADQGLAFADRHLPAGSPLRVNLMRIRGEALGSTGRHDLAEGVLRGAIALQERSVGTGGVRLGALYNGLGIALNDLGRYREAVAALQHSRMLETQASGAPIEDAIGVSNLAATLESAGDYAQALSLFEQALATLDASGVAPDDLTRRMMARNHARTLALAGEHARAADLLADLRQRARQLDGEDSFEYAMTTWQATLVARRSRDPDRGLSLLAETGQRFSELLPADHPVFAHLLRASAAFAVMQRDLDRAERDQREAVERLGQARLPVEVAIARAELAGILAGRDQHRAARIELAAVLPLLREVMLPQELSRAAAEALAAKLSPD
jgi:eukaryotic-like serine/threonine-protein kinase